MSGFHRNALYYGDCLEWMQKWNDCSVDLIYLDPPFNSNVNYNILYADEGAGDAQYRAFNDIWYWDTKAAERLEAFQETLLRPARKAIIGLHHIYGNSGMISYFTYMAERIEAMHRLLKPTGSLYLHCDPTASHGLKMILDAVFGQKNFRNEIVWQRTKSGKSSQHAPKSFGRNSDTILFYTKSERYVLKPYRAFIDEEEKAELFPKTDRKGRRYALRSHFRGKTLGPRPNLCFEWRGFYPPHPSGWALGKDRLEEEYQKGNIIIQNKKIQRRQYLSDSKGKYLSNIWYDIPNASSGELLGYPTQKPLALMDRIIKASSNEGDVVLDPFCGCGTTVEAARRLGRDFVGIDISSFAIDLIRQTRLRVENIPAYGIPLDFPSATRLASDHPFAFESWAIARLPGFAPNTKQVADGGVDGRAKLALPPAEKHYSRWAYAQVKGGKTFSINDLRAFCDVLNEEKVDKKKAALGCFVTLKPVRTQSARECVAKMKTIRIESQQYNRLNLWSVHDYFDNRPPHLPIMNDPYTGKPMNQIELI